jgi:demethoxyubiquinone hydroxylase (CLK1/Coq7/Cat5 family)
MTQRANYEAQKKAQDPTSALNHYQNHLAEMEGLAYRIDKALTQMRKDMNHDPNAIHWGHVGSASDMRQKLQDFVDQAFQEGEYAEQAEGETRDGTR